MRPSLTRNVSGNAIRIGKEWTIVDCGEGTQHQIIKCQSARISPAYITRIFITHLHGDHCFGLPGILCLINNACKAINNNNDDNDEKKIVQIVGPKGLRNMVRAALLSSVTNTCFDFCVDELWTQDDFRDDGGSTMAHFSTVFQVPPHDSEQGGKNVRQQLDGTWIIPPHPGMGSVAFSWTFHAAPLVHTVPSVGFVFREGPHRGRMDGSSLRGRLVSEENRAYQLSCGIRNPLSLMGMLQRGEAVTIKEDGIITKLEPADFMGPPTPGRVLAVLGDTCDSRHLAGIAANADIIVHEATNAAIEDDEDEGEVISLAISRGHSTPTMAGAFARSCGAKQLVLTHFSSRYKGDDTEESLRIMDKIVGQAKDALGHDGVLSARDMMVIDFRPTRKSTNNSIDVTPESAAQSAAAMADSFLEKTGNVMG